MTIPNRQSTGKPRPFVFVQLAPYLGPTRVNPSTGVEDNVAFVRAAQMKALALPGVAMASAIDWGDIHSPYGDIHPRWKSPVGERLALAVGALTYGDSSSTSAASSIPMGTSGPFVLNATVVAAVSTSTAYDVRVTFDQSVTLMPPIATTPPIAGLLPAAAQHGCQPAEIGRGDQNCATFIVNGKKVAKASVGMDTKGGNASVLLKVGAATPPKRVSYLHANFPVAVVWAQAGAQLPAAPFEIECR